MRQTRSALATSLASSCDSTWRSVSSESASRSARRCAARCTGLRPSDVLRLGSPSSAHGVHARFTPRGPPPGMNATEVRLHKDVWRWGVNRRFFSQWQKKSQGSGQPRHHHEWTPSARWCPAGRASTSGASPGTWACSARRAPAARPWTTSRRVRAPRCYRRSSTFSAATATCGRRPRRSVPRRRTRSRPGERSRCSARSCPSFCGSTSSSCAARTCRFRSPLGTTSRRGGAWRLGSRRTSRRAAGRIRRLSSAAQ